MFLGLYRRAGKPSVLGIWGLKSAFNKELSIAQRRNLRWVNSKRDTLKIVFVIPAIRRIERL